MKKKNSFDWKKGCAVLLVCFLSVGLILGMISIITSYNNDPEEDQTQNHEIAQVGNQKKPDEIDNTSSMNVGLVEYTHYRLDELDFQFVIAKVRIKADEPIHISLEHFKTSEGIALNQVDEYVNDLESNALFLGKQNVWFEIISQEKIKKKKVDNNFTEEELNKENTIVKVLVQGRSEKDNKKVYGYTETMKLVNINGSEDLIGQIVDVKIVEAKSFSLDGIAV